MRTTVTKTRYGLLLSLLLIALAAPAQERDFSWYNDSTYRLYQAGEWPALIALGQEALRRGHDYYYLRLRLGLAYYQTGRHQSAAGQFYRALAFNRGDVYAREMLAYSLLAGGRGQEARLVYEQLPDVRAPLFRLLSGQLETGLKIPPPNRPLGNLYYGNAGLTHSLGPHLTLTHQYQYLEQRLWQEEIIDLPRPGNGPPRSFVRRTGAAVRQQEYYLGAAWQFSRGWRLLGGFHPLWVADSSNRYPEYVAAIGISKAWPRLQLSGAWSRSSFANDTTYRQIEGQVLIYPLGDTRLYLLTEGIIKEPSPAGASPRQGWIGQRIGLRVAPATWLEGRYAFGDIDHFAEQQAAVVYNLSDPLKQRYGGGLQHWIGGRHLLYAFLWRERRGLRIDTGNASVNQSTLILGYQFFPGRQGLLPAQRRMP